MALGAYKATWGISENDFYENGFAAFELASPRFLSRLVPRRCYFAAPVEIFEISFSSKSAFVLRCRVWFFPFFRFSLFFYRLFLFAPWFAQSCSVVLARCFVCFIFRFRFVFSPFSAFRQFQHFPRRYEGP